MRRLAALLLCASCGGGGDPPAMCEVRTSLIDQARWTQVPVDGDPFRVDGRERCTDERMREEPFNDESSYTIETNFCSWGTVEQPSLIAVAAGETLNVRLYYFSQTKFETAVADLVVADRDQPLWSKQVPLPSTDGGLLIETVTAPHDIPAGEPLRFHVANHGTNSWNLLEVSVSRMEPCQKGAP